MIKLNKMEQNEYNAFIVAVVPSLLPGTYHFRDFSQIELHLQESVVNSMKMLSMVYIRIFLLLGQRLQKVIFVLE